MNRLYCGDNLAILRQHIASASVDLIYLDPPFNSGRRYRLLRQGSHQGHNAHRHVFDDTWGWDEQAEQALAEIKETPIAPQVTTVLHALIASLGKGELTAYLIMMTRRLGELYRVLKPSGSFYLHCDSTASHYLKVLLDALFGPGHFVNQIVWQRSNGHNDARQKFADVSDILLLYAKSDGYTFHVQYIPYSAEYAARVYRHVDETGRRYTTRDLRSPTPRPNLTYVYQGYAPHPNGWSISLEKMQAYDREGRLVFPKSDRGRIRLKRYLDEMPGVPLSNVWSDIKPVQAQSAERWGYPTQKPLALLERIVQSSSNRGDIVLDPFCGSGTTLCAAQRLERRWIGIDREPLAIEITRQRLEAQFGEQAQYELGSA